MALQFDKLMDIASVATGASASFYANPASTKTYVGSIILHNSAGAERIVTLNNVPDSAGSLGTPAATNQNFKVTLATLETLILEPKYPFVLTDTNDAFFGLADGSGVTVQLLGTTDS
jgi:hypothetical protein